MTLSTFLPKTIGSRLVVAIAFASLVVIGGISLTTSGNGTVGINAPLTCSTGNSVTISGRTAGTTTISQSINDTAAGISLTGNTGATINFTGALTVSTGVMVWNPSGIGRTVMPATLGNRRRRVLLDS